MQATKSDHDDQFQAIEAKVDEVVDLVKVNVNKIMERQVKLDVLEAKADQLQAAT